MEIPPMGKTVVAAKIENLHDVFNKESGTLELDEVRFVEVNNALVDTGVTMLSRMQRRSAASESPRPPGHS